MSFSAPLAAELSRRALLQAMLLGSSALALGAFSAANAQEAPVEGGNLIFSDVGAVPAWQTQRAGAYTTGNVLHQVLDRLTYFDPAGQAIVPWLASEFSQNADATEFTFKLRPGVTFSDGSPLDAEAVAANYDLLGKGNAELKILPSIYITNYDRTEIVDPLTVKIVLNSPNASFLFATSSIQSGVVSKATLALDNIAAADPTKISGSGPFVYDSHIPDQQIVLRRRADYAWPPATSSNQGAAYLETVTINVLGEVGLRVGALTSGQLHVSRGIQPTDEAPLEAAGFKVAHVPAFDLTSNFSSFRPDNPIVNDLNVRRALNIGFDREKLVTVLGERYRPAYSVLNSFDANLTDLRAELAFDPDKARALLEESGWVLGSDGIREKDGVKLHLDIPGNVNQQPAVLLTWQFIQEQWRTELGVDLDVRASDPTYAATARTDPSVPLIPLRTYQWNGLASLFNGKAQAALMTVDPDIDALFEEERQAIDPAARKEVLARVQKLLIDKAYVIPTSDEVQVYGHAPNVHIAFDSSTHPHFQSAWIGA